MYHLPLLPGYGPNANIRSSAPAKPVRGRSFLSRLSEAEENGYQGTYFTSAAARSPNSLQDGYISSTSPIQTRQISGPPSIPLPSPNLQESEAEFPTPGYETGAETGAETDTEFRYRAHQEEEDADVLSPLKDVEDDVAEVVFFEYGVVVFFGLLERQEKDILEDIEKAEIMKRNISEEDWEIEECHFAVSSTLICNWIGPDDFF